MPTKQVYGKRTAVKAPLRYAKLLSPDKDDVLVGEQTRKAARKGTSQWSNNDVTDIEKDFGVVCLAEEEEVSANARNKRTVERRSKVVKCANNSSKDEKQNEMFHIEKEMRALHLEDEEKLRPEVVKDEHNKAVTSRRGAFEIKSVDMTTTTLNAQTSDIEKLQSPPPLRATRRKLKAVAIPRSKSPKAMPQLPTPDPTPEPKDIYTNYVSPLLSISYGRKIIPFKDWCAALEPHFNISKIAEASFSEVYRLTAISGNAISSEESVLKLVALRTPANAPLPAHSETRQSRDPARQAKKELQKREEQDQWKSQVEDVHSEVKLLKNLNHIPGFTNFRELTVLQGRPPSAFVNAWKVWNKSRPRGRKSEFPDPSKKMSYEDTQLWAVIEMQDAGTDCEKLMEAGGLSTVWEVWDVFWAVCLSVAKAEEACKFEHRDMHLENICIRPSQPDTEVTDPIIRGPLKRKLGFSGLETTVIDYTISRANILPTTLRRRSSVSSYISGSSACSLSRPQTPPCDTEVAYLDLNKDMALFTGDATEEYQYEIYRYMRGTVFYGDPLKTAARPSDLDTPRRSPRKAPRHIKLEEPAASPRRSPRKSMTSRYCEPPSDIWKHFHPKTNLVWAHFILYRLLKHLKGNEPANLSLGQMMRNMKAEREDAVKVVKKAQRLYKILEKVAELLEPGVLAGKDSLGSMKELVVLAMEERWLRVEDVAG